MSDRVAGALLVVIGATYTALALTLQAAFFTDPLGPRFVPTAIGLFLMASASAIMIRPTRGISWPERWVWTKVVVALFVFIGYAYLLEPVGFLISTTLAFGLFSRLFGAPYWRGFLAGALFSLVLYAIFVWALDLYLPVGDVLEAWL